MALSRDTGVLRGEGGKGAGQRHQGGADFQEAGTLGSPAQPKPEVAWQDTSTV